MIIRTMARRLGDSSIQVIAVAVCTVVTIRHHNTDHHASRTQCKYSQSSRQLCDTYT